MDLGKVEQMMTLMRRHGMQELEIEDGDQKIRVVCATSPVAQMGMGQVTYAPAHHHMAPAYAEAPAQVQPAATAPAASRNKGREIRSPFVGTFYAASSPNAEVFVKVGQRVNKGDVLCIIEAMKLMNEIEAEESGTVTDILIKNGETAEFDQVLFIME
jgi:acetyl-CoA carboxylase biotin carboxyl carrier protein